MNTHRSKVRIFYALWTTSNSWIWLLKTHICEYQPESDMEHTCIQNQGDVLYSLQGINMRWEGKGGGGVGEHCPPPPKKKKKNNNNNNDNNKSINKYKIKNIYIYF